MPSTEQHVLVVADGDVPARASLDAAWPGWADGVATVIAADGGLARARAVGLDPGLLVGDLDSLDPTLLADAEAAGLPIPALPRRRMRATLSSRCWRRSSPAQPA